MGGGQGSPPAQRRNKPCPHTGVSPEKEKGRIFSALICWGCWDGRQSTLLSTAGAALRLGLVLDPVWHLLSTQLSGVPMNMFRGKEDGARQHMCLSSFIYQARGWCHVQTTHSQTAAVTANNWLHGLLGKVDAWITPWIYKGCKNVSDCWMMIRCIFLKLRANSLIVTQKLVIPKVSESLPNLPESP